MAGVLLVAVIAGGALVAAAIVVPGPWRGVTPTAADAKGPARAATSPTPSPTPNDRLAAAQAIVAAAAPPVRLQVPSIRVDAPVEPVGLDAQGRMATPSLASNVAWYKPGAVPGNVGDAVMAGHLDWTSGPAVFWYLGKVKKGDEITVVRSDGSKARFIADRTSMVPYDSPTDALFTVDGPPSLTLITCAGSWDRQRGTYLQRLVVHATLAPSVNTNLPGDEGG